MFELWADKKEPAVRLIVPAGSDLPADLGPRDWMLLGPAEPDAEVARAVAARGYHFFRSETPILDHDRLKNSDAAGA
jgi:hypothetical protein